MRKFDLHMHSHYSKDGEYTPFELIQIAKEKDMKVIALCDHDGVKGVEEMITLGKNDNIEVIPAIECSTLINDHECHLLGYGIDIHHPYFQTITEHVEKLVTDAFHERIVKLEKKYPIKIDEEQVLEEAGDTNPWFIMCQKMFSNPEYAHIEDFKDYIPGGKRSDPAPVNFFWDKCQLGSDLYVRVEFPDFKSSVEKIHESGGIAVLAHPFKTFYKNDELLQVALDAGIDGIEVYSNYHDEIQTEYYREFALKHNLIMTCGSDFHGKNKPSIQMGEYGLKTKNEEILNTFLNTIKK